MEKIAKMVSIIAPVFNEEEGVEELVERICKTGRSLNIPFEAIIVNDGSRDQTLTKLLALSRRHPELRVIDLMRNFGPMAALTAGLSQVRGNVVVVLDGDLQDPPELIPTFLEKWREGMDVVYGLRTLRRENFLQRTAIAIFHWVFERISEIPIPRQVGTFGLMDRSIVDTLNLLPEKNRFFAGLRCWTGGKQTFVPYEREKRKHGKSRVGLLGMIKIALPAITSFSKVPLRQVSLFSLMCGLILFLTGLGAIIERLFTDLAIPGWATYTALIGFMGFVNSIVMATIAEYIAVIFDEVKARPLFLIHQEFQRGEVILSKT